MKYAEPRRTISDVVNPEYDGRRRYGSYSIKTIPAGTFFMFRDDVVNCRDVGDRYDVVPAEAKTLIDGKDAYTGSTLARLMKAASVPDKPATALEALIAADSYSHFADEVLQKLLERGIISTEQIIDAVKTIHAESK